MNAFTRRRFLATTTAGATAAIASGSIPGCGPTTIAGCGTTAATVTVADVPVGTWVRPTDANYFIAQDSDGFYAYSSLCTHQGCSIDCPAASGVATCPCHGSVYNGNGDVTTPAAPGQANLDHYAVTFQGTGSTATILVDVGTIVADRFSRVPPPT